VAGADREVGASFVLWARLIRFVCVDCVSKLAIRHNSNGYRENKIEIANSNDCASISRDGRLVCAQSIHTALRKSET
jgi:hypothetical protein